MDVFVCSLVIFSFKSKDLAESSEFRRLSFFYKMNVIYLDIMYLKEGVYHRASSKRLQNLFSLLNT